MDFTALRPSLAESATHSSQLRFSPTSVVGMVRVERPDLRLLAMIEQDRYDVWIICCSCNQGHNEVRWRLGQEASLPPPCSDLSFFGSKCTV